MQRNSKSLYTIALLAAASLSQAQIWLGTNPVATSYYGGALIDFKNESASAIGLTGRFDLNLAGPGGVAADYRVYVKSSALSGSELNASAWTLLGATSTTTNAQGTYTTLNVNNTYLINPGQTIGLAFFIANSAAANGYVGYRSGTNTYTDGTVRITAGLAKGYRDGYSSSIDQLFNVDTFNPRTWSGRVEYTTTPVPEPASMAAISVGAIALFRRRKKK